MKSQSKIWKKLTALGLSAALLLSLGVTAFAAAANTATLEITKEIVMPRGTTKPTGNAVFTFTPTEYSLNGTDYSDYNATTPNMPSISDVTIAFDGTEADTTPTDTNVQTVMKRSGDILAAKGINGDTFGRSGIFRYELKENASSFSNLTAANGQYMDLSQVRYRVQFKVAFDSSDNLFIEQVVVQPITTDPDTGGDQYGPKVEGGVTDPDNNVTNGVKFVNTYGRQPVIPVDPETPVDPDNCPGGLTVGKTVAGDLGDRARYFNFAVSLELPSTLPSALASATYKAYLMTKTGNNWAYVTDAAVANSIASDAAGSGYTLSQDGNHLYYIQFTFPTTGANRTKNLDVDLAHNTRLVFMDLPLGTLHRVQEDRDIVNEGYVISIAHTVNGAAHTGDHTGTDETAPIGEGVNSVIVTNTLASAPITGILANNLPFLALILLAGGCFVFFIVAKSRERHYDCAE